MKMFDVAAVVILLCSGVAVYSLENGGRSATSAYARTSEVSLSGTLAASERVGHPIVLTIDVKRTANLERDMVPRLVLKGIGAWKIERPSAVMSGGVNTHYADAGSCTGGETKYLLSFMST